MIFYFEALAIASAVLWASGLTPPTPRLPIYTDSLNCVNIFNTLSAHDKYNEIYYSSCASSFNITSCSMYFTSLDMTTQSPMHCHNNLPHTALSLLPKAPDPSLQTPSYYAGVRGVMFLTPAKSRQPPRAAWSREQLIHEHAIAPGLCIGQFYSTTYNSHLQYYLSFCKLHSLPLDPTPIPSHFTLSSCRTTSNWSQ